MITVATVMVARRGDAASLLYVVSVVTFHSVFWSYAYVHIECLVFVIFCEQSSCVSEAKNRYTLVHW